MGAADVQAHRARSQHNERLAQDVSDVDAGWGLVVRFYSALHLTQAYLMTKNERFEAKRHDERWRAIRRSPELGQPFRSAYKQLQDVSEQVRYDAGFETKDVHALQAGSDLQTVKLFLNAKLAKALGEG